MSDRDQPTLPERLVALLEVLLCSGFPTQLAIGGTLKAFGYGAFDKSGALSLRYVAGLSLVDAALVIGLVLLFLTIHDEHPRDVIVGRGPVAREVAAGLPMVGVALGIAVGTVLVIRVLAPRLHTVAINPLEGLLTSPRHALLFGLVVIVAGGVREEMQRAFILLRFERWLGGRTTGIVVSSVAFGAGHLPVQGVDVAIATALLGAFWAVVYLRRRSAVAPMVSHAGFDLIQIVGVVLARRA